MKKISCAIVLALVIGGVMWAESDYSSALQEEISALLSDMESKSFGEITVGEAQRIADLVSIRMQMSWYVHRSQMASFIMPGMGQFINKDTLGGSLFLASEVGLAAGSMAWAYFLLPANVRFDSLNYLTTPKQNIKLQWETNSLQDYLPSMAVMAGGMLARGALRLFSSAGAASQARTRIAEGKVTFTPSIDFLGHGFRMGMRARL